MLLCLCITYSDSVRTVRFINDVIYFGDYVQIIQIDRFFQCSNILFKKLQLD